MIVLIKILGQLGPGKDLFKPLRLCLTGQNNGPEMANLVLTMGRQKIVERLNNKN